MTNLEIILTILIYIIIGGFVFYKQIKVLEYDYDLPEVPSLFSGIFWPITIIIVFIKKIIIQKW